MYFKLFSAFIFFLFGLFSSLPQSNCWTRVNFRYSFVVHVSFVLASTIINITFISVSSVMQLLWYYSILFLLFIYYFCHCYCLLLLFAYSIHYYDILWFYLYMSINYYILISSLTTLKINLFYSMVCIFHLPYI